MISNGSLVTVRLEIRPFRTTDIAALVVMFSDPMVARYVGDGGPLPQDDAALWVKRSNENLQHYGYGTGAVIERASGILIGWAGFARPQDGPEQIIYGLAKAYWRQGFGTEIVEALVQFAGRRGLDCVLATVDAANRNSIHLLRSQGFALFEQDFGGEDGCDLYRRSMAQ